MKKYILCFVLVFSTALFITSYASLLADDQVPIAGEASGTPEELKQFPVVFNGEHIMNIYLQHIGKTPENQNSFKAIPPERREEVDFYHSGFENITEYTMEIIEAEFSLPTYNIDKQGKRYKNPPKKFNRSELLESEGIGWLRLYPYERQISKDDWVFGQVGLEHIVTYTIKILDTNEIFAIRIIYTRVP